MNNPWNIQNSIVIEEPHRTRILQYIKMLSTIHCKKRINASLSDELIESKKYLETIYNSGYGIKIIARALGLTYTVTRVLLKKYFKFDMRTGTSVVTDKLREFRAKRVSGNMGPWYDWPAKGTIHNSKGIQGYFLNKNGEYIWLRSCWEYIYAKWLDNNNIDWKFEVHSYSLSNGERYLPDFFIYENNQLEHVVEIKGFNKTKIHKLTMFENEYNIKVVIIEDIKPYCNDYGKELELWKTIRLSEKK